MQMFECFVQATTRESPRLQLVGGGGKPARAAA
jgi:hypothetical protein